MLSFELPAKGSFKLLAKGSFELPAKGFQAATISGLAAGFSILASRSLFLAARSRASLFILFHRWGSMVNKGEEV